MHDANRSQGCGGLINKPNHLPAIERGIEIDAQEKLQGVSECFFPGWIAREAFLNECGKLGIAIENGTAKGIEDVCLACLENLQPVLSGELRVLSHSESWYAHLKLRKVTGIVALSRMYGESQDWQSALRMEALYSLPDADWEVLRSALTSEASLQ
jgi:hypothetical protein